MTEKLLNYLGGQWQSGADDGAMLSDPVTGQSLVRVASSGMDLKAGFAFARESAGPALRAMSYAQRAALLTTAVKILQSNRDR